MPKHDFSLGEDINFCDMPQEYWSWRIGVDDLLTLQPLGFCGGYKQAFELDVGHGLHLFSRAGLMEFLVSGRKLLLANDQFFTWSNTFALSPLAAEDLDHAIVQAPGNTMFVFERTILNGFLVLAGQELMDKGPGQIDIEQVGEHFHGAMASYAPS